MRATVIHMTWSAPDKEEMKQLNTAMLLKALRVLLSCTFLSAYVTFIVLIRYFGFSSNATIGLTIISTLPVLFYYTYYRNALSFGRGSSPDEEVEDTALNRYLLFWINMAVIAPVFLIFADKLGVFCYVLIALMGILTYRKEILMLILFVMKRYTVKDGDVFYRERIMKSYVGTNTTRYLLLCFALVYLISFEDAQARKIPVMVDHYTYRRFKENGDALIIRYRFRDLYLFEVIRLK